MGDIIALEKNGTAPEKNEIAPKKNGVVPEHILVLGEEDIYRGNLLLVNAEHPLRSFQEERLVSADGSRTDVRIERDAANVLQFILQEISGGNAIVPVSGFRSAKEQTALWEDSLAENGEAFTRKYVARPNHSEHQTGLAIDLGLNQENIDFICPEFPYEGICQAFREAAPNYGFIERYGKGKEPITGISHEPWHFRYVGFPHSKIMTERGLCLEEYMEFMRQYREDFRLTYQWGGKGWIEIYYVPAAEGKTRIALPKTAIYQISGNNMDGFFVTVWRK